MMQVVIIMGMTFENLTWEELCDLMCGQPEDDEDEEDGEEYEIQSTLVDSRGCKSLAFYFSKNIFSKDIDKHYILCYYNNVKRS